MNAIITILISLISGLAGVFVGSLLNQKKRNKTKEVRNAKYIDNKEVFLY